MIQFIVGMIVGAMITVLWMAILAASGRGR